MQWSMSQARENLVLNGIITCQCLYCDTSQSNHVILGFFSFMFYKKIPK